MKSSALWLVLCCTFASCNFDSAFARYCANNPRCTVDASAGEGSAAGADADAGVGADADAGVGAGDSEGLGQQGPNGSTDTGIDANGPGSGGGGRGPGGAGSGNGPNGLGPVPPGAGPMLPDFGDASADPGLHGDSGPWDGLLVGGGDAGVPPSRLDGGEPAPADAGG